MSSITNNRLPADPTLPWRFLHEYQPLDGTFDEMLASAGVLRPQCEAFVRSIESMGPQEFAARRDNARRAIRENGVTYNVYGDPQGIDRPWELDMVPLIVLGRRMEPPRRGTDSADQAPQPDPARSPRPAAAPAQRPAAAIAGARQPGFSSALSRHPRAARHLPAHARRRSGAVARWRVGRARRSHAGAVGRRLCARKPARPPAQPAGSVPRRPRFSGWRPSSARSATR